MRIAIDAGHGPETLGKRCPDGSMREFEFNQAVAEGVKDQLLRYPDVDVLFTHDSSRDVPLKERTTQANRWGADVFVSIHANAVGNGGWDSAGGIETYVYPTRPAAAVELAEQIQQALVQATGLQNRGVKHADFHVLRETTMTAVLIECGFMTNPREAALLKGNEYRQTCAEAIASALATVLGLTEKSGRGGETVEESEPTKSESVPEWASEAVAKACAKGLIDTPESGSYDFYRVITVLDRLHLLD